VIPSSDVSTNTKSVTMEKFAPKIAATLQAENANSLLMKDKAKNAEEEDANSPLIANHGQNLLISIATVKEQSVMMKLEHVLQSQKQTATPNVSKVAFQHIDVKKPNAFKTLFPNNLNASELISAMNATTTKNASLTLVIQSMDAKLKEL